MSEDQHEQVPLLRPEDIESTPVYPLIQMIRSDVMHFIDTPLSYEALTAPDLTYTLVRPLEEKYLAIQHGGNMAVVFCFLLNRVHFIRDDHMISAAVSKSRAALCEILAIRTFREYGNSMLQLTLTLTTTWSVYSAADPNMLARAREERDDDLEDRVGNAIELAIMGKAKRFIKSDACQKVIDGIWTGRCVYQAESSHSILSDTYKRNPIHFYDPNRAPLLDHYRLKVPAIRSVLEYMNFLALFVLFVIAIEFSERNRINTSEAIFMIYALGFTLEKVAAMQEHGIKVYFKGTWNGFDLAFVTTYCIYAFLRLYGVYHHRGWARTLGIDFLALIACLLFPRLAFVTFKNNLLVLSLRAMMMQFVFLMLIAAFCFCGFLYALWTLSQNQAGYTAGTIAWWMLDLWFGLDASGFDNATKFHPFFGPILMVTYACLSNTLLLTVLVSILTNTFATINEDAAAEAMFRKAVSTIEGVKADSLFSYQPPVNLVALCIMLPASYILSPRWFHKVNVFMIRLTSFPILLLIALYERQAKEAGTTDFAETMGHVAERMYDTFPRALKRMTFFEGLAGSDADIDAVFEIADEFDSALDTEEINHSFNGLAQRRVSTASSNRAAQAFGLPRVNPTADRAIGLGDSPQTFSSPLAQLFQPLIVNDDISEQHPEDAQAQHLPGVSYGPASRRRLTSIQSAQKRPTESLFGQAQQNRLPMRNVSLPQFPMATGSDIGKDRVVESENLPDSKEWMKRIEEIEKREERIEALLLEIAADIRSSKTVPQ